MLKVKKMQAGHYYMIRGSSTANSSFFERESDCKLFLTFADRYLGGYMKITCFQNNRDGWAMLIATRSTGVIKRAYRRRRALSLKCNKAFELEEVWQILSDQVRIFLSTFVKAINQRRGREGGMVRCRYERFVFEDEVEASRMRDLLESEYYLQAQPLKRYRPSKKLCDLRRKLFRTSIYLSSALLRDAGKARQLGLRCLDVGLFATDVVRQLILRTKIHHFPR